MKWNGILLLSLLVSTAGGCFFLDRECNNNSGDVDSLQQEGALGASASVQRRRPGMIGDTFLKEGVVSGTIESDYRIVRQDADLDARDSSIIQGIVRDKFGAAFAKDGVAYIVRLKKSAWIDSLGFFKLVVPPGSYQIQVFHTGSTRFSTDTIEFRAGQITELEINLGTYYIR